MDLSDAQWSLLQPFFLPKAKLEKRGRPPKESRSVLNGVLWGLRTGAPWHDLPSRYPPYQTCHRWFQQWQQEGTLVQLLRALVADLRDRGKVDWSESFIDATFAGAKKGALELVQRAAAKGPRSWQSQTAMVFLPPCASASPNEIELVEVTVRQAWSSQPPPRLIGDRAYDSDPVDERLRQQYRVKLIAPHKGNRRRVPTQDGRKLRRYRRRWKIERMFAWLHNFRRLVNRWECYSANFLAMVQLGCAAILLRYF